MKEPRDNQDSTPHPGDGSCERCGAVPAAVLPTVLCEDCSDGVTRAEVAEAKLAQLKDNMNDAICFGYCGHDAIGKDKEWCPDDDPCTQCWWYEETKKRHDAETQRDKLAAAVFAFRAALDQAPMKVLGWQTGLWKDVVDAHEAIMDARPGVDRG